MIAKYDALLEEYKNANERLINYVKSLWISLWIDFSIELLKRSFTHKSFSNDVHKKVDSNERLEFLWDSILWFIVADNLYHEKNIMQEDMMSLYKISLVNEKILAKVAREINAWDYIFLWLWELNSDWKNKDSVLSDFIEAFIAYLYLDLWEQVAKEFIDTRIYSKFSEIRDNGSVKSPKSVLQEYVQRKYKIIPVYKDFEEDIDEKWNTLLYRTEVYMDDNFLAEWTWVNKKTSQANAASNAIKKLWIK